MGQIMCIVSAANMHIYSVSGTWPRHWVAISAVYFEGDYYAYYISIVSIAYCHFTHLHVLYNRSALHIEAFVQCDCTTL